MGLQIGEIVPRRALEFSELRGKIVCVDAFNTLYQFLSTIRQPDGTQLMDKQGRVTSHLSGLFYRNINLLQEGLRLVYVFDGKAPDLKFATNKMRQDAKDEARQKYELARDREDIALMGKYAKQFTTLTGQMIQESKELLAAMGIGVMQAPGEGEAEAAFIAKKGAFAVASQDYDSLLFGAPRLIQNLTLSRKRKTASGVVYISPEMIELEKVLNTLQINHDQLICIGILAGSDYNPGGIRGIGQKKALQLVRQHKQPALIFDAVKSKLEVQGNNFDWREIYELFHRPNVAPLEIGFPKMNEKRVKEILLDHDFSLERIENQLLKLGEGREKAMQRTLF